MKIMICEDERIDRQALRMLIGKTFPQLIQLEDCVDGTAALARVPKEGPDILILDINMPGCDGIEVVRRLRGQGYEGKIMICTAYDRFAYALDALNYGADAFLLKPVKHAQFIDTLRQFIDALEREQGKPTNAALDGLYEYMLPQYLSGGLKEPELRQSVEGYLRQHVKHAFLAAFSVPPETWVTLKLGEKAALKKQSSVDVMVREALEASGFILFDAPAIGPWKACFISRETVSEDDLRMIAIHRTIQVLLRVLSEEGVTLQCAVRMMPEDINAAGNGWSGLSASCKNVSIAQMFMDEPAVGRMMLEGEAAHQLLEKGLPAGSLWQEWLRQNSVGDRETNRFGAAAALLLSLGSGMNLPGGALQAEVFTREYPDRLDADSIDHWVICTADEMIDRYFARDKRTAELSVRRACAFIRENYQRDISLSETAEYVGVSVSHLSHQFREKLGVSFVDYLQNVRMERLMELLGERDYSVRELSDMLGFNNHTYFCQVVRQRTGKTIRQLKQSIAAQRRHRKP